MSETKSPTRRVFITHLGMTAVFLLILVLSIPLALHSLTREAAEDTSKYTFLFYNLSIAAVPFTIALSLACAWIYHRGGAPAHYSLAPYLIPCINLLVILLLRIGLGG